MDNRKPFKLGTWNIGGGILGESHQTAGRATLDYHVEVIQQHSPDVICLQEAHDYDGRREGQAEYIARQVGYSHVVSFPISPSHMDNDANLSLGILSRSTMKSSTYKQFPNPGLKSVGPNGSSWTLFDKGYVECIIDAGGRALGIVNAHCFPLHYFNASPTEPRFATIWEMLVSDLESMRCAAPTLVAIDLNYEPIEELLGELLAPDRYVNAFAGTPTIPAGSQQDYLLYDSTVRLVRTTVRPTLSDHFYCQMEIEL